MLSRCTRIYAYVQKEPGLCNPVALCHNLSCVPRFDETLKQIPFNYIIYIMLIQLICISVQKTKGTVPFVLSS